MLDARCQIWHFTSPWGGPRSSWILFLREPVDSNGILESLSQYDERKQKISRQCRFTLLTLGSSMKLR